MKTLAALLLCVCSSASAYFVEPDRGGLPQAFTYAVKDDLRDSFARMFELWSASVNHYYAPVEIPLTSPQTPNLLVYSSSLATQGEFGVTTFEQKYTAILITTAALPKGNNVDQIMLHELGHALGLGHTMDYLAMMYPEVLSYRAAHLGQDDIMGLHAKLKLPYSIQFTAYKRGRNSFQFWCNDMLGSETNWDYGDGVNEYDLTPSHRYRGKGPWTVTVTVQDFTGTMVVGAKKR